MNNNDRTIEQYNNDEYNIDNDNDNNNTIE